MLMMSMPVRAHNLKHANSPRPTKSAHSEICSRPATRQTAIDHPTVAETGSGVIHLIAQGQEYTVPPAESNA